MIKQPIVYSDASRAVVDDFETHHRDDPKYWENSFVTPVRDEIKAYYRTAQLHTCPYCNLELPVTHGRAWDTEHIVPRSIRPDFTFEPENLCVACLDCNLAKSDSDVRQNPKAKKFSKLSDGYIIVHPHFDCFGEHIMRAEKLFMPLSEKGANTIHVCKLYRFAADRTNYPRLSVETFTALRTVMEVVISTKSETKVTIQEKDNPKIDITISSSG